jgi:hypothetical protein
MGLEENLLKKIELSKQLKLKLATFITCYQDIQNQRFYLCRNFVIEAALELFFNRKEKSWKLNFLSDIFSAVSIKMDKTKLIFFNAR